MHCGDEDERRLKGENGRAGIRLRIRVNAERISDRSRIRGYLLIMQDPLFDAFALVYLPV